MKFHMFTPLRDILPKTAAALGVRKEIEAALVCEKYRKFAPQIVHPDALLHTSPKNFRRGVLTVGVENSAWASVILKSQNELLSELKRSLPKGPGITAVRTKVINRAMLNPYEKAGNSTFET